MRQILSILAMMWAMVVCAQTATQNYVLSQTMLDDGSIGDIDNLTYSYDGNQLVKVDDSADAPTYSGAMHFIDDADEDEEYRYDANGNMTADLNNDISSIRYNALNLPSRVEKGASYIIYTYTANGEKIRVDYYKLGIPVSKENRPTLSNIRGLFRHSYTEYCGNHIFENGELKQTLFAGGYVTYSNGNPEYHFYVRDHQGNNRLVMNEDGIVEQVNDYTPFGVQMKNSFAETSDQRYKYNGKELDRMLGLDLYDYGARFYDARIARWQTIDPLCEKYYSISPYAYCANNPLNLVDRDGRELFIASGSSRSEVQTIVKTLQKLTDDRVVCVIYSTGTKKIAITSQNKNKHAAGTKLVRSLVNSKHNGYIGINDATHKFHGSKANSAKTFAADKASQKGVGSDGYVNFNPEATTVHVTNPKTGKKEAKKRPIEIGLGHELLHLLHYFDGVKASKGKVGLEPNLKGESSPLEELNTVGLGNLPPDYPTEIKYERNMD